MLKFFNQIGQRLMAENKFGRYISSTANFFSRRSRDSRAKAEEIVGYIDEYFTEG